MRFGRISILLIAFGICVSITLHVQGLVFAQDSSSPTVTPTGSDTSGTPSPTPDSSAGTEAQKADLQNKIKDYESKISDLEKQQKSLSSQIKIADSQIALNELRINDTNEKIADLQKDINVTKRRIDGLETDIEATSKAMIERVGAVYQVGTIHPWQLFLTSDNLPNFMDRAKYLKIVQENDKKTIYAAQQSKLNYAHYQSVLAEQQKEQEDLQSKLEGYSKQLDADKQSKKQLLTETQGSEANYQKLLNQAQAQLASFSRFVNSQGGASILSGQTSCDSWGCYYNQRDSQWGTLALNGTQYSIASDGCLVTSMAMMYTHYGHRGVTPATINSNSGNFASYYPAFLSKSISADGASSQRIGADLDATLASGNPVVVGISYDGGPLADHFVVFLSGSGGNYQMHDPFTPNGHNISFRGRYPSARIVEIERVAF